MTLPIKAELLVELGNWQRGLTKANKQLTGFGKSMKTISNGVKAAWAGVALLGLNAVGDALADVTKAASADAKSQALLNKQMDKSWKATKKTKDEMNRYIDSVSNMSGIQDDDLRPAMSKIVAVTKSAAKAQKSFGMVMDISAGSGKDLNTVSQAFAKYLGGNKSALDKLIPGLKDAGDKMGFLQQKYGGMAAVAGNNDPFARITVVMDNFKEKLGTAFLPVVQKFADWLASDDAQKALDDIAGKVQKFGEWFASPEGQETFKGWMDDLKGMIDLAGKFLDLIGDVSKFLGNFNTPKKVVETRKPTSFQNLSSDTKTGILGRTGNMSNAGNTTINMVVNGTVSGNEVVTALTRYAKGKGIPMSKLLR